MRANRLPAAVRTSTDRLEDLKVEAEFFAYDRLVAACDEAMTALEEGNKKDKEDRSAKSTFISVDDDESADDGYGDYVEVHVRKGKVLFLSFCLQRNYPSE